MPYVGRRTTPSATVRCHNSKRLTIDLPRRKYNVLAPDIAGHIFFTIAWCHERPHVHWLDHSNDSRFHAMDGWSRTCRDRQRYEATSEIGHQICDGQSCTLLVVVQQKHRVMRWQRQKNSPFYLWCGMQGWPWPWPWPCFAQCCGVTTKYVLCSLQKLINVVSFYDHCRQTQHAATPFMTFFPQFFLYCKSKYFFPAGLIEMMAAELL